MKKLFLAVLVASISVFSYQVISAQKLKDSRGRGEKGIDQLNLSDIQNEKFNEIRFAHQETKIDLEAKLKKNRLEVKKMMESKNIVESQLMKLIENGSNLQSEIMKSKTKMWLEVYNILDKEQKEKWINHFERMSERGERFMRHNRDSKFMDGPGKFRRDFQDDDKE